MLLLGIEYFMQDKTNFVVILYIHNLSIRMHDFDVKMFVQENGEIFTCEKNFIQNSKSIQTLLSKDKPKFEILGFLLFNVFPCDVFRIA